MSAIRINVSLREGDGGKSFGEIRTDNAVEVHVYESLVEPGVLIIDVDNRLDAELKVTVNDGYVFNNVEV